MCIQRCVRAIILLSCVLFVGCITTRKEEEMRASIQALERRMAEMNSSLPKNLENVKNEAENAQKRMQANRSELDELRKEIALSQGAIDELRVKFSRVQESSAQLSDGTAPVGNTGNKGLEETVAELSSRVARAEMLLQNIKERSEQKKDPKTKAKYKNANELGKALAAAFVAKDYKKVVSIATPVIDANASKEQLELAYQFRGEAHFALQNYERAASDFTEFVDRFPKSDKKARALLMTGDSFVYLKQPYVAKGFYSECVKKYAEREECKASKERLARMGM